MNDLRVIDIDKEIPLPVRRAYKNMVESEKKFQNCLDNHSPACPIKEGGVYLFKRWYQTNKKPEQVIILSLKYNPYSYKSWNGFVIQVAFLKKDGSRHRGKDSFLVTESCRFYEIEK